MRASISRLLPGLVIVFLGPGLIVSLCTAISRMAHSSSKPYMLLAGTAVGVATWFLFLCRQLKVDTFVHELGHYLASLLFLRRIPLFQAKAGGDGVVVHTDGFGGAFGSDFIGLAPYFFPPITLFLALIGPAIRSDMRPWFGALLGVSLGLHLGSVTMETKRNWSSRPFRSSATGEITYTDIRRCGYFYSTLFILGMNLVFLGAILSLAGRGYEGITGWGRETLGTSTKAYAWIGGNARDALDSVVAEVRRLVDSR